MAVLLVKAAKIIALWIFDMEVHMRKFSKFLAAFISAVLVLSMAPAACFAEVLNTAPEAYDTIIDIVHTNDVHARVTGDPYVAALIQKLKSQGDSVLTMSAGDALHGQAIATLSRGENIVNIMNTVGYDIMVPGNHDFNYGISHLFELEKEMKFSLVAANVTDNATGKLAFTPYKMYETNGLNIGVFGLCTPETATKTNPKNVAGYTFEEPVPVAEQMVKELKSDGADVVIALTHLGIDPTTLPQERSDAVAAVDGIDVIIDGHSHTVLEHGEMVDGTLIAQTGSYLANIGLVRLYFNGGKLVAKTAELIPTPADGTANKWGLTPDPAVQAVIDAANQADTSVTAEVVGQTPINLDGEKQDVRSKETNLSDIICDSMIYATGADAALNNGGGIRASIAPGEITRGDVLDVLPFGDYIVTCEITGAELKQALELGLDTAPDPTPHFLQVGGIRVNYNSSLPAGSRVQSATFINGAALDDTKTYTVAVNDFLAAGGDNMTMFPDAPQIIYGAQDDALVSYIQSGVDLTNVQTGRLTDMTGIASAPAATASPQPTATPTPAATTQPTATPSPVLETPESPEENIPSPTPAASPYHVYVIKPGDCLYNIAKSLENVSWGMIADLNGIESPYIIYPGQKILLPY
jgi:2',3'-cyclic-nucleotide 2'-phosphodiesterase (5'-nucleotidase family)